MLNWTSKEDVYGPEEPFLCKGNWNGSQEETIEMLHLVGANVWM